MWKIRVLFLVFVFFSVKESNATYNGEDRTVWTAGSAVNVTFGPEDAVYCKVEDNKHRPVYDDFGPCRVVVDRVTMSHRGYWKLWIGVPGKVITSNRYVYVDVVAAAEVASTPEVTGSVIETDSTVILQCIVPEEHEVMACTFTEPSGSVFIATREVNQQEYNAISYKSFVDRHDCNLTLSTPLWVRPGIWRCAVNTAQVTSHGFFVLNKSMLDHDHTHDDDDYYRKPVLQSSYSSILGMEGDAKTLFCSINAAVRYCYFRAPNGTVYNVGPSTSSPGYEYVGKGFDAGECGIRFNNIWASDEGLWSCNVGLKANFEEQRDFINIYVNQRLVVNHRWSGNSVVVRLRIFDGPKLEYCRFVRSDGLGFSSENVPPQYVREFGELYGTCALTIPNPTTEDLRPWTIVAKVIGEDREVSMTTTLDSRGQPGRRMSGTAEVLLVFFFSTIFVFLLIAVCCIPKKNREWTYQRAASIRNSFRRQPQPQPLQQHVTDLPKPPVHTDILTDLPRKF